MMKGEYKMEVFGFYIEWTFLILLGILICLIVIMIDISKIRDHHQYMFERKLEEENEKFRKEVRKNR